MMCIKASIAVFGIFTVKEIIKQYLITFLTFSSRFLTLISVNSDNPIDPRTTSNYPKYT